jgi:hypothetical protein
MSAASLPGDYPLHRPRQAAAINLRTVSSFAHVQMCMCGYVDVGRVLAAEDPAGMKKPERGGPPVGRRKLACNRLGLTYQRGGRNAQGE